MGDAAAPAEALVLCVHHKPWLAMATCLTALLQDDQLFDVHVVQNVGDGNVARPSYEKFRSLQTSGQLNDHLSAYEPEAGRVAMLRSNRIRSVEYENDHSLDSGAFYKFILDRRWMPYEYVLFAGEGTLFARQNTLSAMTRFARDESVHFIQSGHEQRRLPKDLVLQYCSRHAAPTAMDRFHDEMIRETFAIFCRDPEFDAVFKAWSICEPATEHHVPAAPPRTALGRRLRRALVRRLGAPHEPPPAKLPRLSALMRELPYQLDYLASRASIVCRRTPTWPAFESPQSADRIVVRDGVTFHRVPSPEWFGCTPTLLMSRTLLQRFVERLERFRMRDVLDLPFAASGLEIIWGFIPAWLGVEKWFTDGFHRVRKDFVTYRREDYAPDMASYINRYHRGRIGVAWQGEHLKLRAWRPELAWMKDVLPASYF